MRQKVSVHQLSIKRLSQHVPNSLGEHRQPEAERGRLTAEVEKQSQRLRYRIDDLQDELSTYSLAFEALSVHFQNLIDLVRKRTSPLSLLFLTEIGG